MSEKTYREFLEVESRPYAEFRERIMRHLRRRLLHRRPAKWWRHPKAWTTIRGKHWGKSFRSYIVAVAKDHRQNERRWKNATN